MGKKNTTVQVNLTGNADGLQATLQKAGGHLKDFGKQTRKDLNVDTSFLDKFAAKAKEFQRERRASGEMALERLSSGAGLTRFGLQALGVGAGGFVAEAAGRGFASMTENIKKLSEGSAEGNAKLLHNMAEGIPILGEWVKGWTNIIDMISGAAEEEAHLNRELERQKVLGEQIERVHSHAFAAGQAGELNPLTAKMNEIEEERLHSLSEAAKHKPTNEPDQGFIDRWTKEHISETTGMPGWMASVGMYGMGKAEQWGIPGAADAHSNAASMAAAAFAADPAQRVAQRAYQQEQEKINAEAEAKKARLKHEFNMADAEAHLALTRRTGEMELELEKSLAKSTEALWNVEYATLEKKHTEQVADLQRRMALPGVGEQEKMGLQGQINWLTQHFQTEVDTARNKFDIDAKREGRAATGSTLGIRGDLLSRIGELGVVGPAITKARNQLAGEEFSNQMMGKIEAVLNNPQASAKDKANAEAMKTTVHGLIEKIQNPIPSYMALQLASAEGVGARYSGGGAMVREKDQNNYLAEHSGYLKKLVELMQKLVNPDQRGGNADLLDTPNTMMTSLLGGGW